ncbi:MULTISPECIES: peptide-N-glycosidase F-related protein [Sphingobacterium]|uniref:peptide-N-glycosidase F-related protein n=1 Tax=Sphingobacterium TaxID=28453 RepID=UPI0013DC0617|nr:MULTISPECIES: peptide-N-glycosidase F-related protein [unclassified Sphingobacterium]
MKYLMAAVIFLTISGFSQKAAEIEKDNISIFKDALFFDGYANLVDYQVPPEIIRTNTTYVRKLTAPELKRINGTLEMQVLLKPACDNYDRIANVSLALVEKGQTYSKDAIHIEIGRFITPFMDKNKSPNEVPYIWNVDHIAQILLDKKMNAQYDFYIGLSMFGVSSAAQKEVKGCEGRKDVFIGNLSFIINKKNVKKKKLTEMKSIVYDYKLNNYKNTDTLGKTVKEITLVLDANIENAKIYLITSNHGANRGGEEYTRRIHNVYLDGKLVLNYIPGEPSCEPYRVYNTQGNGIYGRKPRTDKEWQSFSNWCPGALIPTRVIELGRLKKGSHVFKIEVPDAQFLENKGYIPVSAFIQG